MMTYGEIIEFVDSMMREKPETHIILVRSNGKYFDWYVRWLREKLEGEDSENNSSI